MPEAWLDIVANARTKLAAGESVNRDQLAARIRATTAGEETEQALAQLDRVLAVARARARLAQPATLVPPPRPSLRTSLRSRPSLTANMDVRRELRDGQYALMWDRAPGVVEWEVRVAERADVRSEYMTISSATLDGASTSLVVPVNDRSLRIHLLGRARGGKLVRRAVITGLSRDNWDERWQKRASAA